MKRYVHSKLLLMALFVLIVISSGCTDNVKPKYQEIVLSKYVPATEAFNYFPENIKTTHPVESCETFLKKAKNEEDIRLAKIFCFGNILVFVSHINGMMCDNKEVLRTQIDNTGKNLQEKVLLNCPKKGVESTKCKIKESANCLRESIGVYEENVDFCINDIVYQNKNTTKIEMLNYLAWLKKVITEVENI